MKAIKKVAVTPVQVNNGTIIDSFNTSDDKHTNAPSLNAVDTRLATTEGNITTLQTNVGTLTTTVNGKQSKALSGTSEPSSSLGNNGDIYFQYNA